MKCKESVATVAAWSWPFPSQQSNSISFIFIKSSGARLLAPLFQYLTGANIENAIEQAETTRPKQVIDVAG